MSTTISWLHLTDLHLGLDGSSWLWPKVKRDFYKDMQRMSEQAGVPDVIFFTGDLTQSGSKAEFDKLTRELEEFWKLLAKLGGSPVFCPVPGNHDLVRPSSETAATRAIKKLWESDPELRKQFWSDAQCEYRNVINQIFQNYTYWLSTLQIPMLSCTTGILPGDYSAVLSKADIRLGIVGLNTTFLQIAKGDYRGKLEIHVSQLNAVCGGDPVRWISDQTASVLLTHQPPSWLNGESLAHFRQEIDPPGRFLAQFCGHQHEPEAYEYSEAGAVPRRLRQGPSIFGLESWESTQPAQRTHGYSIGQFQFEPYECIERMWPRIAIRGRHGGLNLCPDHTYSLTEEDCVLTNIDLEVENGISGSGSITAPTSLPTKEAISETPIAQAPSILELIEQPPNEQKSRTTLATCPRLALLPEPQHRYVRQDEQSQLEHELRKTRCAWLIADWGTGKVGFLAACLDRFKGASPNIDVFHLRCDEASDIDTFEALFTQQFALTMQVFCNLAEALPLCFLILDDIHPELCKGSNISRLVTIVQAMIDYCPSLSIILCSRVRPEVFQFTIIQIQALEAPDVRIYLQHHSEATEELRDPDTIEKLHEYSEGLPMHLDRMVRGLRVSSLSSVLEAALRRTTNAEETSEETSIALVHSVSELSRSADKRTRRSFRMLKVLSVLPYGETLETLNHYLPTEPFFLENAIQLADLALLDTIPLVQFIPKVSESTPKVLRVPRQVRDYISSITSEEERMEIIAAGAEKFFGRQWRDGKIKLRNLPSEFRDYVNSGAGNEFAIIHHIIATGRDQGDRVAVNKGIRLGIHYLKFLDSRHRFRDLVVVAGAILRIVDSDHHPKEWSHVALMHGRGLRMIGKNEEAQQYLRDAWEIGEEYFSENEKASLWLNTALNEEKLQHKDEGVLAAREVLKYVKEQSPEALHAQTIITGLTSTSEEKIRRLSELEKHTRDQGYTNLADTISMEKADLTSSDAIKLQHYDKILGNKERGYNQVLAIVLKTMTLQAQNKQADISLSDLSRLSFAYTYLYAQRLSGIFDLCHEALWSILEIRGDTAQLLRLFRHASFLWRIRGEEEKETKYLKRIPQTKVQSQESPVFRAIVVEVKYYFRRFKILLLSPSSEQAT